MNENASKAEKLAKDILILSRNTLLVNFRFLDMALSRFEFVPCEETSLATEGHFLCYNPLYVLKNYKYEKESVTRDYLHLVMHCVFQHMFMSPMVDRKCWDLACDIAVENAVSELASRCVASSREGRQQAELAKIKNEINILTAEKIYRYFIDKNLSPIELAELRGLFYADDHTLWYMREVEIRMMLGRATNEKDQSENSEGTGNENGAEKNDSDEGEGSSESRAMRQQDWKNISERMQTDIETFGKRQGYGGGNMVQNLKEVNREKYDYTAFLKKFAVIGEAMKINDDEFDYIFYTYGLKLYDKMPLIEPLEYKDVKRIREFVIAIDTSGSTSGDLVQAFLQKTYNILKSTESFFSKMNLHIIQCDAEIQEHVKITKQEEFDEYLKTMKIHGLGGTDFRPVFSFVDNLIEMNEFTNLKGLIYFTDGCGDYPQRKPAYETAIVFIDDNLNDYNVPPWAIKLILQKEEI